MGNEQVEKLKVLLTTFAAGLGAVPDYAKSSANDFIGSNLPEIGRIVGFSREDMINFAQSMTVMLFCRPLNDSDLALWVEEGKNGVGEHPPMRNTKDEEIRDSMLKSHKRDEAIAFPEYHKVKTQSKGWDASDLVPQQKEISLSAEYCMNIASEMKKAGAKEFLIHSDTAFVHFHSGNK